MYMAAEPKVLPVSCTWPLVMFSRSGHKMAVRKRRHQSKNEDIWLIMYITRWCNAVTSIVHLAICSSEFPYAFNT